MNPKEDIRNALSADLSAFIASGGTVTTFPPTKVKRSRLATGHQKTSFGWRAPTSKPSNPWNLLG
jgi:hypothetical protein